MVPLSFYTYHSLEGHREWLNIVFHVCSCRFKVADLPSVNPKSGVFAKKLVGQRDFSCFSYSLYAYIFVILDQYKCNKVCYG